MTIEGENKPESTQKEISSLCKWDFSNIETQSTGENKELSSDANRRFREWSYEDFSVWYGHFRLVQVAQLSVRTDDPLLLLSLSIHNQAYCSCSCNPAPFVQMHTQHYGFVLLPAGTLHINWPVKEETEHLCLAFSLPFLQNYLPLNHPIVEALQEMTMETEPVSFQQQQPLTSEMLTILYDLLHPPLTSYRHSLWLKGKVLELLALQLEQAETNDLAASAVSVPETDVQKMHLAREYLVENLEKPLSLKDLSHQVGTNEYNLKRCFKEVFGMTVFGYLHHFRMEAARKELMKKESKIAEVAQKMGYKHATHFTAAFKKHFGYLPHKIRVNGLL
ncbi:helix-turn-helix transcriptional regulator [Arundinibacter roseus]|uniref:AraC family transcriptional regulator n=1 Tax=Arundinibacter roseus TaxID=2070510 RepID=A0A4R4KKL8_9BACT|nr:AraC family transcriptional regulator [Arundinibacter roseus]TDB67522.1 AraC family transcriptional regulator [Arundinibacter roseus]